MSSFRGFVKVSRGTNLMTLACTVNFVLLTSVGELEKAPNGVEKYKLNLAINTCQP